MRGRCPCCHSEVKDLKVDPKVKPGYVKVGKKCKCKVCGKILKGVK